MSQRIFTNQVFSNTGIIGVGFKINFFEVGTTTPKATFSDTALTVANTNPIIADANGRFIDVFVEDVKDFKAVLTDTVGNTLKTLDPVDPKTFSVEDFDPRPLTLWGITAGSADNYTLTADPAISENKNTHIFLVAIHVDCNAAPDLAIDGLSAKNLKKYNGAGDKVDLEAGDLRATQRYFVTNDGSDYIVLNPESQNLNNISGGIMGFAFETPPVGWLECDGSGVSRTTFAKLFAIIGVRFGIANGSTTFKIPDLRGEFIRGWSHVSSNDPDRLIRTDSGDGTTGNNVGTKQLSEFVSHVHTVDGIRSNAGGGTNFMEDASSTGTEFTRPTLATGGLETRPRNVYMMFCIKF